jgi:hypothetical protein
LPNHEATNIDIPEGRTHGDQKAVLIGVVKFVEYPELLALPTFVWLDRVDRIDGVLPHALYFSHLSGLVFRGVFVDREIDMVGRRVGAAGASQNELVGQMVEGAPETLDRFPRDDRDAHRNVFDARDVIDQLARIRITLGPDSIWLGIKESLLFDIEI